MLKYILIVIAAIIAAVAAYIAYVFLAWHRIPDNAALVPENGEERILSKDGSLHILSWNIGFGAYSDDYSFFMNGGRYSRAYSKDAVLKNLNADIALIRESAPDIIMLQEVDTDSDRAWHVNEADMVRGSFPEYSRVFARNYDSPYLLWPLRLPHGASKSGMLTLVRGTIASSVRRSLPIEGGFMKFLDLDRCYSITRVPVQGGGVLCLFTLHLSAYTSDGEIAVTQLRIMLADMARERAAGNYVIAGGDFNKDILQDSSRYTGVPGKGYSWAKPFPLDALPEGFTLIAPFDPEHIVMSCRASDTAYHPGKTFTVTLDAFIVSDNVKSEMCRVIDAGFKNSDHNPIEMRFRLL